MRKVKVGVAGATGAVGREMIKTLERLDFPVENLRLFASERSKGIKIPFRGKDIAIEVLEDKIFEEYDTELIIMSAGGSISKEWAPRFVKHGSFVVDNSSAWRMEKDIPLVVPEVNPDKLTKDAKLIANPNCSTIQMVVVLKPLHDHFKIKRVVVSTYQSVTGAGNKAVIQLQEELAGRTPKEAKFPHRIAFNCLPHIDIFFDDGYTKEEVKMMKETQKIMGEPIKVTATTVRVPVIGGHSESVNIEFEKPCTVSEVRSLLQRAPGVIVQDDPAKNLYPMPLNSYDKDEVFVGRIRKDETIPSGINLWIVSDNIRKGAATNAVQIAEALIAGA